MRWIAALVGLLLAACTSAEDTLSKEAIAEIETAFANKFQDCGDYYEVGGRQIRPPVATWNFNLQVKGFEPSVLPLEVSREAEFSGVEYQGLVSLFPNWTARKRSAMETSFGTPATDQRWSDWTDWMPSDVIKVDGLTIIKQNGQWNTEYVLLEATAAAAGASTGDKVMPVKQGCSG